MEKFRVISDLHMDINRKYPLNVKKDDIFTVIAGDTSGHAYIINAEGPSNKIDFEFESDSKLVKYFGKTEGNVELVYSSKDRLWTYNGELLKVKAAGIRITEYPMAELKDGDKIDISIFDVEKWIRKSISSGVLVAGNHLVYNNEKNTIEDLKKNLHEKFPLQDDITFLDNSVGLMTKEVDGILFVGSTLYTNYEYVGENTWRYGKPESKEKAIEMNLRLPMPKMSGSYLNDFSYGRTIEGTYKKNPWDDDDGIYWLSSKNYLEFFKRTFKELERIVEENKDKEIVVVSHHCPSPKCISKAYVDDELNASYISDLEEFITKHENIKCWCCGHVHHRDSFMIGKNCRVVMNPLGYCRDGQFKNGYESKMDWSFNTFVNTKTWEVETEPFDFKEWDETYEEEEKKRLEILRKYGDCFI